MTADDATRAHFERLVGTAADRGLCLDAACYRDPVFFELERERVLRRGWHAVARWDELPEPGDYASLELCGEPLLVVRDEALQLRVLSRVCRHRAHTVVEGRGNAKRLVCPYHRWSYGLDGALATAPMMDGVGHFDPVVCGLPELRTERWQGFLLVSLDPAAPSLASELGELDPVLAPEALDEMVTVDVLEFDSPWNWKVLVDNFMESYHHIGPHSQTLQKNNRAQETYCVDAIAGPFSLLENPGHQGAPDLRVVHVFPTLLMAWLCGTQFATWYEMQIDRPDHLHLRIHLLAAPQLAVVEEAAQAMREQVTQVHHEDIRACQGVQRGLSSQLWEPGPLSRYEGCLSRFHRYLAARLG